MHTIHGVKIDSFIATTDAERAIVAHGKKQFDAKRLNATTRYALRRAYVPISAAGTISGMTMQDADTMLEKLDPPLDPRERMAVKGDLARAGILMTPYRGLL